MGYDGYKCGVLYDSSCYFFSIIYPPTVLKDVQMSTKNVIHVNDVQVPYMRNK